MKKETMIKVLRRYQKNLSIMEAEAIKDGLATAAEKFSFDRSVFKELEKELGKE